MMGIRQQRQGLIATFLIFSMAMAWGGSVTRAGIITNLGTDALAAAFLSYGLLAIVAGLILARRTPTIINLRWLTLLAIILIGVALAPISSLLSAIALFTLYKLLLLLWLFQWREALRNSPDTHALLPLLSKVWLVGALIAGVVLVFAVTVLQLAANSFVYLWLIELLMVLIGVWRLPQQTSTTHTPPSLREGFSDIAQSMYLRWFGLAMLLFSLMLALLEYWSLALVSQDAALSGEASFDTVAVFFAMLDIIGGGVLLVVQMVIVPRLMQRMSASYLSLIYPLTMLGVTGAVALLPANWGAIATYNSIEPYRHVFGNLSYRVWLNFVPAFVKVSVRVIIEQFLAPFAYIVVGVLIWLNSANLILIATVGVTLIYVVVAIMQQRQYSKRLTKLLDIEDYATLLNQDMSSGRGDVRVLHQLHRRLQQAPDAESELFLATLLLEIGHESALSLLIDHAQRTSVEVRRGILQALVDSAIIKPTLREFLLAQQQDRDPETRRLALTGLIQQLPANDDLRLKLANDHIHDGNGLIRGQMATVLLQSSNKGDVDKGTRVLKAMQSDFDPAVRIAAIRAIANLGDVTHIRDLVWLLDDDVDIVRLEATYAIEQLWRDDMPDELTQLIVDRQVTLLDDPVERIRSAELALLSRLGKDETIKALLRGLADTSSVIQLEAVNVLTSMGQTVIPALQQASLAPDKDLARRALIVLTRISPQQHEAELLTTLRATLHDIYDNYTRIAALLICKHYSGFDVLRLHFLEENRRLLEDVFTMLRTLYDAAAINTIYETLQSDNPRTRSHAATALEQFVPASIVMAITPLFDPASTPHSLAEAHYERQGIRWSTNDVLRELVSSDNSWLRAVTILALSEAAADNPDLRRTLLEDTPLPKVSAEDLPACQRAIDPKFAVVAIRTAQASHDSDIQRAANAANRLVRQEFVFDMLAEQEEQEPVLSNIERMIYLKRVPFFQSLAVAQLKALASICEEEIYRKGTAIFRKGDSGGSLYIVISGEVEIGLQGRDGTNFTVLATYGANTVFGEMSLFDDQPRSADALVNRDTMMLSLHRDAFMALTRQFPDLSLHIITMLSNRLREANTQIAQLNGSGD